jgi:hypothetical protein
LDANRGYKNKAGNLDIQNAPEVQTAFGKKGAAKTNLDSAKTATESASEAKKLADTNLDSANSAL